MPLPREKRRMISTLPHWSCALRVVLSILLFAGSAADSPTQLKKPAALPPAKAEPTAVVDPLGRETPRGTMMGFAKYGERRDFATAARYLQLDSGQATDLVLLAKELQALRTRFKGNLDLLSDEPNGWVESGLQQGEVRAGVIDVGSTVDVILVRVDDPESGKIWLISKETIAEIPGLYAQLKSEKPTAEDRIGAVVLSGRQLLGMSVRQWLGWLLSIPISWLLSWLLAFLLSVPRRVWCKLRGGPAPSSGRHRSACRSGASSRS